MFTSVFSLENQCILIENACIIYYEITTSVFLQKIRKNMLFIIIIIYSGWQPIQK